MPEDIRRMYDEISIALTNYEENPNDENIKEIYRILVATQNFLDERIWDDFN